jgi:hypothetical protein
MVDNFVSEESFVIILGEFIVKQLSVSSMKQNIGSHKFKDCDKVKTVVWWYV